MSLSKFKFNTFVSYSRKNENEVDQLCKFLKKRKIYFVDRQGTGNLWRFRESNAEGY